MKKVRKNRTYTDDDTKGTSKSQTETSQTIDSVPQRKIWKQPTPQEREIMERVVRPVDRTRQEVDPTQGWGSKLNMDINFNKLPKQNNKSWEKAYRTAMQRKKAK